MTDQQWELLVRDAQRLNETLMFKAKRHEVVPLISLSAWRKAIESRDRAMLARITRAQHDTFAELLNAIVEPVVLPAAAKTEGK